MIQKQNDQWIIVCDNSDCKERLTPPMGRDEAKKYIPPGKDVYCLKCSLIYHELKDY